MSSSITVLCVSGAGGTLTSLGEAYYTGLGDQKIVTTLCPGGKERMHRLVQMIAQPLVVISSTSICAAAKERSYSALTPLLIRHRLAALFSSPQSKLLTPTGGIA